MNFLARAKSLYYQASHNAKGVAKAVSTWVGGLGSKVAVGIRYALSMGTPGRWASDHREESTHFTGWNYVAIKALALQAASADVVVYQDGGDKEVVVRKRRIRKMMRKQGKSYINNAKVGKQLPPDDRLMKLLRKPNPSQTGALFRYEQIVQLQLTGTCIVWNVRNAFGLPVERYVIPTCMCYPVPPSQEMPRGGWRIDGTMSRFQYPMDQDGFSDMQGMFRAMGYVIPMEQTQVIRWPHPIWKDDGYSPLAAGALWSDTAEQMDQSRWANLKQGPNPSLIITAPEDFKGDSEELEEASEQFNQKYAGPSNSGKAMFVTAGKVENFAHTGKEMDYAGGFPQMRECMLALHGTPPVAVGIATEGSHAAFYVGMKQYIQLTVQPVFDMLAEDDTEHLLPYFGEGLTEEWTAHSPEDPEQKDKDIKNCLAGGAITKGELRQLANLEPWGDERDDEIAEPGQATGDREAATEQAAVAATGKPPMPGKKPAAKDDEDESGTGIPQKHFNRLMNDPVMKAAVEGALAGVRTRDEAIELAETWKWNGQAV